jgi:hypothetical protein
MFVGTGREPSLHNGIGIFIGSGRDLTIPRHQSSVETIKKHRSRKQDFQYNIGIYKMRRS